MTQTARRLTLWMLALSSLLAGCAGDGCEYMAYEEVPETASPLVMPAEVSAPAESGEFSLPPAPRTAASAPTETCLARPPMTLPEEVLREPEDEEGEAADAPPEAVQD